jgi:hypothetical protein
MYLWMIFDGDRISVSLSSNFFGTTPGVADAIPGRNGWERKIPCENRVDGWMQVERVYGQTDSAEQAVKTGFHFC